MSINSRLSKLEERLPAPRSYMPIVIATQTGPDVYEVEGRGQLTAAELNALSPGAPGQPIRLIIAELAEVKP